MMRDYLVATKAATTSRRPKRAVEELDQARAPIIAQPAGAQGDLLRLQRQYGNRAVQRILRQIPGAGDLPIDGTVAKETSPPTTVMRVSKKKGVELPFVIIKRKNISLKGGDKYGHWWTEIDGESYGWWPKYPVGLSKTLFGTEGELNGTTSFGGTPTRDPHHGESADEQFHPTLSAAGKTEAQVKKEIQGFAAAYHGEWRWTLGWGQNCRTFQKSLMKRVGLQEP